MKAVTSSSTLEVAGRVEVLGDHERQPVPVVGDVRAHASAGVRLPPVQHVALGELVPRRLDDLLADEVGSRDRAAPSRPAAGRGSRTRRSTGRSRCVPTAGTPWPGRAAGRSPCRSSRSSGVLTCTVPSRSSQKPRAPARARRSIVAGLAVARDELAALLERRGLAEQERDLGRLAGGEVDVGHERAAVVVVAARDAAEPLARHRRRVARARRCGRRTRCGSRSRSAAGGRRRGTRSGRGSRS